MKKVNITSLALLPYLIVMSVIGWPGKANPLLSYTEYFGMIGIVIVIILLLRYLQIKRLKLRKKWNEEQDKNNMVK